MAIYLLLSISAVFWGVILYVGKGSKISKKLYLIIIFSQLIVVAGLRASSVGTDTKSYIQHFKWIANTPWSKLRNYNMDLGYVFINKVVSCITRNPQVIIFIISFITLLGFAIFIYNNSNNVYISTFLFITLYQYCTFFNAMRQFTAVMFVCNSLFFLKKNKYLSFITLILCATLFHKSALVFLPLIVFNLVKNRIKCLGFIAIAGLISTALIDKLLNIFFILFPQYSWYKFDPYFLQPKGLDENILIWIVQLSLVLIAIYLSYSNIEITQQEKKELYLLSVTTTISIILNLLTVKFLIIHRLNYYFYIFIIIFIPKLVKYFGKYQKFIIVLMYLSLIVYYYIMLKHNNHQVVPYQLFTNI